MRRFQYSLRELFIAMTWSCVLVWVNVCPFLRERTTITINRFVSSDTASPKFPQLEPWDVEFVVIDYGWPWVHYAFQSFGSTEFNASYGWGLVGNVAVGIAIILGTIAASRFIDRIWQSRRPKRPENTAESVP